MDEGEESVSRVPRGEAGQRWGLALLCLQLPAEGILCLGLSASASLWDGTPTSPKVPQIPFLLLHPSHDSVLRNVPGAKGKARPVR